MIKPLLVIASLVGVATATAAATGGPFATSDGGTSRVHSFNSRGEASSQTSNLASTATASGQYALTSGGPSMGSYSLGGVQGHTGFYSLTGANSHNSVYSLNSGASSQGVYGLTSGAGTSGLFSMSSQRSQGAAYGLSGGGQSGSVWSLSGAPSGSSSYALGGSGAASAMFSHGAATFAGNGHNVDYVYGSTPLASSSPTAIGKLCGTPRSYTRFVLREAAALVQTMDVARAKGINSPRGMFMDEQQFLRAVTAEQHCLASLFLEAPAQNGAVALGSIAAFADPAVPGGKRFAIAANQQRCGGQGVPGEFLWIYLDDGFPAVSSCTTLAGLPGFIGTSSVTPIAIFRPRI